jgi:hypothetical protein
MQQTAGNFILIENRKTFWFEPCKNEWAKSHGATHEILLINGEERRACRFLKTVCYRIVDEDANGAPVWEKWLIRDLREWAHQG